MRYVLTERKGTKYWYNWLTVTNASFVYRGVGV